MKQSSSWRRAPGGVAMAAASMAVSNADGGRMSRIAIISAQGRRNSRTCVAALKIAHVGKWRHRVVKSPAREVAGARWAAGVMP